MSELSFLASIPATGGLGISPFTGFLAANLPRFSPDDAVLDIGCGDGTLLLLAYHRGARRLIGVDTDSDACELARVRLCDLPDRPDITIHMKGPNEVLSADVPPPSHVLLNPPTMPDVAVTPRFARGMSAVGEFSPLRSMLATIASVIRRDAVVHVVVSTLVGIPRLRAIAGSHQLTVELREAMCVPFRPWYYDVFSSEKLNQFVANGQAWHDYGSTLEKPRLSEGLLYCRLHREDHASESSCAREMRIASPSSTTDACD